MEDLETLCDGLRTLGDPSRLRLLNLLRSEELSVGELAEILGPGQSTVSGQLARLREAGLVLDRRQGTRAYYRLASLDDAPRELLELCGSRLVEDRLFAADRQRLEDVVLARARGAWLDRAAGSLDRRYVPGRSFESVAIAMTRLCDLGDCVDMGSGDGALLPLLAPAARSLVCLDLHPRMIAAGRARAEAGGLTQVRFVEGDMCDPPLAEASADSLLFLQSLQYAADPGRALAAAGKLCRPRGRCLVLTLGEHGDTKLCEQYGHAHAGFAERTLAELLRAAGFVATVVTRVGYDARSPQLPILLASGTMLVGEES